MAARHAGVHLTLFKYYFTDRTHLLVEVARTLARSLGEIVASVESEGLPAPERFRIRIDAMVDFFVINPFYHRLMVEIIGDDSNPLARDLIRLWMDRTLEIYDGIIQTGVEEGTLRPTDSYFTFVAIMGLCEQYQHASSLREEPEAGKKADSADTAARYKAFIYDLLIHGLGSEQSRHRSSSPG